MPFELDDTYQPGQEPTIVKPPAGGWIKLYRQALVNGWLTNPYLWTFFTYCMLKASHKPHTAIVGFQKVKLDAGQFIFGRSQAASDLKMSERKIRTCQNLLISTNTLSVKTTNKFSIITIVNWNSYQQAANENDRQNDQLDVQRATSNRPATDQQPATNKKGNNGEKEKNEKNREREAALSGDSFIFFEWWKRIYFMREKKMFRVTETEINSIIELSELEPHRVKFCFRASAFFLSKQPFHSVKTPSRLLQCWNDPINFPTTDALRNAGMIPPEDGMKLEEWLQTPPLDSVDFSQIKTSTRKYSPESYNEQEDQLENQLMSAMRGSGQTNTPAATTDEWV